MNTVARPESMKIMNFRVNALSSEKMSAEFQSYIFGSFDDHCRWPFLWLLVNESAKLTACDVWHVDK